MTTDHKHERRTVLQQIRPTPRIWERKLARLNCAQLCEAAAAAAAAAELSFSPLTGRCGGPRPGLCV